MNKNKGMNKYKPEEVPEGVSEWINRGKKYGYYDYVIDQQRQEILEEVKQVIDDNTFEDGMIDMYTDELYEKIDNTFNNKKEEV